MFLKTPHKHHTTSRKDAHRRAKTRRDAEICVKMRKCAQRRGKVRKELRNPANTYNIGTDKIQLQHGQQFARFVIAHIIRNMRVYIKNIFGDITSSISGECPVSIYYSEIEELIYTLMFGII